MYMSVPKAVISVLLTGGKVTYIICWKKARSSAQSKSLAFKVIFV